MSITTYATLQSAVADWLNRDDLTSVIPQFIQMAEQQIQRRLRGVHVEAASLILDDAEVTLPADVNVVEQVHLAADGRTYSLYVTDTVGVMQARGVATGRPVCYAVVEGELWLGPTPDQDYVGTIVYEPYLALSTSQTTNWALTAAPDAYLYGSLAAAAPYLKDDGRLPLWQAAFDRAVNDLRLHETQQRYGGPLVMRPAITL